MKPISLNYISYFICSILFILFISCSEEQKEVTEEENIRVIELDRTVTRSANAELTAVTEELSDYDCDLNWILFDFNSSELSNNAKLELEKVALIIEQNESFKARIRAFTDSKGSYDYNKKLSSSRAQSARAYLISEGINPENISIDGFADATPIAINTEDDTGRKYNRRIELFVLDKLNNTVCRSHPPRVPRNLKTN